MPRNLVNNLNEDADHAMTQLVLVN
jgi:hypothetical protein